MDLVGRTEHANAIRVGQAQTVQLQYAITNAQIMVNVKAVNVNVTINGRELTAQRNLVLSTVVIKAYVKKEYAIAKINILENSAKSKDAKTIALKTENV